MSQLTPPLSSQQVLRPEAVSAVATERVTTLAMGVFPDLLLALPYLFRPGRLPRDAPIPDEASRRALLSVLQTLVCQLDQASLRNFKLLLPP